MHAPNIPTRITLLTVLTLLAVPACGGDDGGGSETPTPTATPSEPEPTFTWISANVLPSCASSTCHGSGSDAPLVTYDDLVGANVENTALGCSTSGVRVVAGDLDNSVLYDKISSASPACGERMPDGGTLSAAKIAAIEEWIAAGAAND